MIMNTWGWNYRSCCNTKEPTLEELKANIESINRVIKCIRESDLSEPTKMLAIDELKAKKASLKELMHEKVNEL